MNTEDRERFLSSCVGLQFGMGRRSYATIDVSSRDLFNNYSFDNLGYDLGLNIAGGESFYFRLLVGARVSAMWVGTAQVNESHASLGIVSF